MDLNKQIFDIKDKNQFSDLALAIFKYQYDHIKYYREFCSHLKVNKKDVDHVDAIPYLPIQFFKSHKLLSKSHYSKVFLSSGTTQQERSKHFVYDLDIYKKSFVNAFNAFYGNPKDFLIAAILPGYVDNPNSSLLYMVDHLINSSIHDLSGFYDYDDDEIVNKLKQIQSSGAQHKIIIGVSFALLEIAEQLSVDLSDCIIMETGGMKGKRQELVREELHNILKTSFKVDDIHSEYGMTELLSQAYSKGNGVFDTPNSMDVRIRDIYQPMSLLPNGQAGGINIIDLSNLYSVSFIATQDLGKKLNSNQFEVIGRFDHSDIRGCNLLIS
ncbi:MAG: acyl transferase [Psychroflexus sp.]|nr:acyl transferase [Psychroflexus sp.]